MSFLGLGGPANEEALAGSAYISKLHKYLRANLPRLAPPPPGSGPSSSFLGQSYTVLTLGLDPKSEPLSRNVKVPLTLGFGTPSAPAANRGAAPKPKPLQLRLPPDRLLYLLLRWQSLPQALPHVGRTDVPIAPGVPVAARGARSDEGRGRGDGDVQSVRSWVGSMRSVSMGSLMSKETLGMGWLGRKEVVDEDQLLLGLYSIFTVLPALLIHPPFMSDPPIAELVDAGGYTQLGGIDVRVPLDVLRNLQTLELESYDPRGLLIPVNPGLRSLTVRDVQDAEEWLEELLLDIELRKGTASSTSRQSQLASDSAPISSSHPLRFANLRHLSLHNTSLITLPTIPLSHLTSLDLSHNLLNAIPTALSVLPSLRSLNLANNLITSVRNAPSCLADVQSLNLSHNRIDCLVGLERVLSLERIDVRSNDLPDVSEVGRLAVLPQMREVWCVDNGFDQSPTADAWRVELGVQFAAEGRDVVFDDRPWSWNEVRRIDTALQQRGMLRPPTHRRQPTAAEALVQEAGQGSRSVSAAKHGPIPTRQQPARSPSSSLRAPPAVPTRATRATTATPLAHTQAAPVVKVEQKEDELVKGMKPLMLAGDKKKRRPPRRVIQLDGNDGDGTDVQSRREGSSSTA